MKRILTLLILIFISIGLNAQTLIAGWTFDATAAAPNTPTSIAANLGQMTATLYADGTQGSSTWITATSGNEYTAFGGTATADPSITPAPSAGNALSLVGGTSNSANGKSIVVKLSTVGFTKIKLNFATRGTSTGFATHQWAYSTDGITFTNVGTNTAVTTTTFVLKSVDLSAITDVDNKPAVYLKLTVSGASTAAGNNRLDNISVTYDAVLNVEMANLSVKNESYINQLSWQTASEKNNAQFNIERSNHGDVFTKIGEVKGRGNSNVEQNYTFTDASPMKGINYYRLRQVDFDGTETLSKTVSVNFDGKGQSKLKVYPTLVKDAVNVELSDDSKSEIVVRDLTGRVILTQNLPAGRQGTEGVSNTTLNLGALSSGLYILSVRSNDALETVKIQKY